MFPSPRELSSPINVHAALGYALVSSEVDRLRSLLEKAQENIGYLENRLMDVEGQNELLEQCLATEQRQTGALKSRLSEQMRCNSAMKDTNSSLEARMGQVISERDSVFAELASEKKLNSGLFERLNNMSMVHRATVMELKEAKHNAFEEGLRVAQLEIFITDSDIDKVVHLPARQQFGDQLEDIHDSNQRAGKSLYVEQLKLKSARMSIAKEAKTIRSQVKIKEKYLAAVVREMKFIRGQLANANHEVQNAVKTKGVMAHKLYALTKDLAARDVRIRFMEKELEKLGVKVQPVTAPRAVPSASHDAPEELG